MQNILDSVDIALPTRAKMLTGDLSKEMVTLKDFQKNCAYWMAEPICWDCDENNPRRLSPEPDIVKRYKSLKQTLMGNDSLSPEDRTKKLSDFCKDYPQTMDWFNHVFAVYTHAMSKINVLKEFMGFIDADDSDVLGKYQQRIKQFEVIKARAGALLGYQYFISTSDVGIDL